MANIFYPCEQLSTMDFQTLLRGKIIQCVTELTPPNTCRGLLGLLETCSEGDVKTYPFSYKMGRSDRQEKQNLPHCCRGYAPNCMRQGRVKFCSLQTILMRTGRMAKKMRSGKSYAIFGMRIIVLYCNRKSCSSKHIRRV
jgi:hypothetical protein